MKIKEWFKRRWKELQIGDPNSPEGLRFRARQLIKQGYALDSPYISVLLKQALLKENRGEEIPNANVWDIKSAEEKEAWVIAQLKIKGLKP